MGWKMEVFRMTLYMAFPVGCFHLFNQPQYFEEWIISLKRQIYPPETEKDKEMRAILKKISREREIQAYEKELQDFRNKH